MALEGLIYGVTGYVIQNGTGCIIHYLTGQIDLLRFDQFLVGECSGNFLAQRAICSLNRDAHYSVLAVVDMGEASLNQMIIFSRAITNVNS